MHAYVYDRETPALVRAILYITILAILITTWMHGKSYGVRHAMEDSRAWLSQTADREEILVILELDGERYTHTVGRTF